MLPWVFYWDYEVDLSDADMAAIGVERADQISIYCVVNVGADVRAATINLFSPIVVNNGDRRARQVINTIDGYSTRDRLFRESDSPTPVAMHESDAPNITVLTHRQLESAVQAREGTVLVLTRKIGETFVVGDNITVTVVDVVGGNKVRLGINAPSSVPVYREEIWLQIQEENRQAAAAGPDLLDQLEPARSSPTRQRRPAARPKALQPARIRADTVCCITFK